MSTDSVPQPQPETYTSPPISLILTVVLLVSFFVGFFSIYFCRCFMDGIASTWNLRHNSPSGTPVGPSSSSTNPGLDPLIIESFPKFVYSAVKDFRKGKEGLECAICLAEFEDDDFLRLLTVCCHVFHQECIDLWLQSHKTCPVCRRSLDNPENLSEKCPIIFDAVHENDENDQSSEGSFRIDIKEDGQEGGVGGSGEEAAPDIAGHGEEHNRAEKFSRSHSTGHSIVRIIEDDDRYTLRLPEHVKEKITRPGHNWTKSCTAFGGYSSNEGARNVGFGEVSGYSGGGINKV